MPRPDLDEVVARFVAASGAPGAVLGVSVGGRREVAVAGAAHVAEGRAMHRDTPLRIASLTKTITAAATVMAFRAAGRDLAEPVAGLLPTLAPDWRASRELSSAHLLGQVSGLRDSVDSTSMAGLGAGDDALLEAARLVVDAGQEAAPGRRWSYYNGNYFLAGAALAHLTRRSFEEAISDLVTGPWGLGDTGFDAPEAGAAGHVRGGVLPSAEYPRARRPSGGLWSTVDDLLTTAECLLADRDLLEQTRTPRTPGGATLRYGLGWALGPAGQMYLNGRLPGYRAVLVMVPDRELVVVMLANDDDALPAMASVVSSLQYPASGVEIAREIVAFAA